VGNWPLGRLAPESGGVSGTIGHYSRQPYAWFVPATFAYRERLLPVWWVWLVALSFLGTLAVAYGAALGTTAGVLVGSAGGGLVVWLLWITSPVILIDVDSIHVAGARIPRSLVGTARPVDAEEIRTLRGPSSDARLFVSLRPWSARDGVLLPIIDPDDPHPAWLFSSRHPARAIAALTATM
jgi:hypothetical protein